MSGQLVYRREECAEKIQISVRSLDRLVKAGQFVTPVKLTRKAVGFSVEDVKAWVKQRQGSGTEQGRG